MESRIFSFQLIHSGLQFGNAEFELVAFSLKFVEKIPEGGSPRQGAWRRRRKGEEEEEEEEENKTNNNYN